MPVAEAGCVVVLWRGKCHLFRVHTVLPGVDYDVVHLQAFQARGVKPYLQGKPDRVGPERSELVQSGVTRPA